MAAERPLYQDRITTDPHILVGKPIIRGTRIAVEHVLEQLADNPDLHELFAAYPDLTMDDVKAALAYARDVLADTQRQATARKRRFRRMLAVASHPDIDGDALLEELERDDAERRARARA